MCLIVGQEESRNDKVDILIPPLLSDSGYAEEPDKGYMGVYVLKENTGTDYKYDFSGLVHGYDCLAGGHATVHVRHVDEVKDCLQNLFVPGPDTGDGMNIYTVDPSACYEGLW